MATEQKPKPNTTVSIRRRMIITVAVMILGGFGLLTYNLGCLQLRDYEEYQAKASEQQLRSTVIPANRGIIYDANMKVLAQSTTVWNISVSPKEIPEKDIDAIADGLADLLEVDADALRTRIRSSDSYYENVKKKVEKPVVDAVREWMSSNAYTGINIDQDTKRVYPYGAFAGTLLGFTSSDNRGIGGLEYQYNDELSGVPGRSVQATNALGYEMPYAEDSYYNAQDGNSLSLTVDEVIQHSLEKNLKLAVKTHNVTQRAVGIVMEVNTGAILGMATEGSYDPNDPYTIYDETLRAQVDTVTDNPDTVEKDEHYDALYAAQQMQWRNKAVADLYEPGSVFKTVTAAAALDSGSATINSSYHCAGSITIAGTRMRCAHPEGHGTLTLLQAYDESCNPSFIQIGTNMGAETFYDYFNSFGLTQKTGIDLPGEPTKSLFYAADKLGPVQLASSSFGQSIKITPIQMITAVSTAINGGNLVQPHVVSKVLDAQGNIVKDLEPKIKRQVISAETSALMRQLMEKAVVTNAQVLGYRVGGKSGTSQKLDTGDTEARIASFVAVAPIDDPEIAVLVILDEPHSYSDYGGVIAAPVVGKVLSDVLPYLGLQPIYDANDTTMQITAYLSDQVGKLLVEAQSNLQKQGFFQNVVGEGTTVVRQYPPAGTTLAKGSTITLYTEDAADNVVTVPDILGRSAKSVSQAFTAAGLNLYKDGALSDDAAVKALAQNVPAGTQVPEGSIITVTFGDNTLYD